jgi:rubredoxin
MNAMFYLDCDGKETTRDYLLEQLWNGYKVYLVYLGGGYVPLTLAVEAFAHDGEAWEAVQGWARANGRLDEIGEDVECPKCGVQMFYSGNQIYGDMWQCPECALSVPQPESYGEVELVIQEVPRNLLETAWVLKRDYDDEPVYIWPATVEDLDREPPVAQATINQLINIMPEAQVKEIEDNWHVVTDNKKIKELVDAFHS